MPSPHQPVQLVYLDVEIKKQPVGRIEMALFPHISPRAAENFRQLCTGESGAVPNEPGKEGAGKARHFKGAYFYRCARLSPRGPGDPPLCMLLRCLQAGMQAAEAGTHPPLPAAFSHSFPPLVPLQHHRPIHRPDGRGDGVGVWRPGARRWAPAGWLGAGLLEDACGWGRAAAGVRIHTCRLRKDLPSCPWHK